MAGSLETRPVNICFPAFFQLLDKCHNICVAFLGSLFIEFILMWLKELLLHREVLKWMNIRSCFEPCTPRIADPVVMHEA